MNETGISSDERCRTGCTRAEVRFQINAHCRFWWTEDADQTRSGAGRTVDVSTRGILVTAQDAPPNGAVVMLEVDLPRLHGSGGNDPAYLLLSAEGTVLRPHGIEQGFAAKISHASLAAKQDL